MKQKEIKVIELFAGIGAFRQALKNQNIPHEVVAFSEIDKYAIEAYRAIHDDYETPNLGDIKEITHLPPCDLLTYGFPCQDISIAGFGKGIKEGTRSGLLLEVERLLDMAKLLERLPKVLILENVKALVQKKHKADFDRWLKYLESLGYTNYWQVLNAKDYGVPQNRERVFVVSILGKHDPYKFPQKQELKLRLRDLLDDEVSENYYLQDEKVAAFLEKYKDKISGLSNGVYPCLTPDRLNKRQNGRRFKDNNDNMFTITAQDRHGVLEKIGSLSNKDSQGERVYTADIAVTQNANGGGLGAKTGLYIVGELSTGGQRARVYNPKGSICCLTSTGYKDPPKILIDKEVSNCVTANMGKGADLKGYFEKSRKQLVTDSTLRVRRLTPLESWRLMGFSDEAYHKARITLNNKFYNGKDRANSQQYKQAGNSIVVPELEKIFIKLYK